MKKTPPFTWILVLICILIAAVPVIFLLPNSLLFSLIEISSTLHAIWTTTDGTISYFDGQYQELTFSCVTLITDVITYFAFGSALAMIFNLLTTHWQVVGWTTIALSGFASALLHWPMIGPQTDHDFVWMVIRGPIIIGIIGFAGLIVTLVSNRKTRF